MDFSELVEGFLLFAAVMAVYAGSVVAARYLAARKRRRRSKWGTLAVFFGPLAVVALLVLPEKR